MDADGASATDGCAGGAGVGTDSERAGERGVADGGGLGVAEREVGAEPAAEVTSPEILWYSLKHLLHMFKVDAEPKNPQPFVQRICDGVSESFLSAMAPLLVGHVTT